MSNERAPYVSDERLGNTVADVCAFPDDNGDPDWDLSSACKETGEERTGRRTDRRLLELAVLPMVLQPHPADMPMYNAHRSGWKKPGCTTTKAHRRKKRAQRMARKHNRK